MLGLIAGQLGAPDENENGVPDFIELCLSGCAKVLRESR